MTEIEPWAGSTAMPVAVTDTGLTMPDDLTVAEWLDVGRPVLQAGQSSMWWIGDWLLYAEQRWTVDSNGNEIPLEAAKIRQAVVQITNLDTSTLRHAKAVAQAFPPVRRRTRLPWAHHEAVATCPKKLGDKLLRLAEQREWSRDDLRAERRRLEAIDATASDDDEPAAPKVRRCAAMQCKEPATITVPLAACWQHGAEFVRAWTDHGKHTPFVYVARRRGEDAPRLVKIGFTRDLPVRMDELGCVAIIAIEGGETLERELHRRFAGLRQEGEWFRFEGALVDWVVEEGSNGGVQRTGAAAFVAELARLRRGSAKDGERQSRAKKVTVR